MCVVLTYLSNEKLSLVKKKSKCDPVHTVSRLVFMKHTDVWFIYWQKINVTWFDYNFKKLSNKSNNVCLNSLTFWH